MGDSSGVYIHYSTKAQLKIAGMISLHVRTNVPPLSRSFQDATCMLRENKVIIIFYKILSMIVYVFRSYILNQDFCYQIHVTHTII